MVRINIIKPKKLADQHLIAEYGEIIVLLRYVKKYPKTGNIPDNYCLGKGHMLFFKDKLRYIKKRHDMIKKEMKKRGFDAKNTVKLKEFPKRLLNDWKPSSKDKKIIRKRIIERIMLKPEFYRYYSKHRSKKFFIDIL